MAPVTVSTGCTGRPCRVEAGAVQVQVGVPEARGEAAIDSLGGAQQRVGALGVGRGRRAT